MSGLTHTLSLVDDSSQSIWKKNVNRHSSAGVLSTNNVVDFDANFLESCDIQNVNELELC